MFLFVAFAFLLATDAKLVQVELFKAPSIRERPSLASKVGLSRVESVYENTQYLANVSVGSPSQKFRLAVHTGSTTMWIFDEKLNSQNGYKARSSTTSTLLKVPQFFDNTMDIVFKGQTYTDVFEISSLRFNNQSFGAIERIEESDEKFLADGLLGLGWAFDSADRNKDEMPIMNLLSQLDKPVYSLWLQKHQKPNQPSHGLLTLGGLDQKNCLPQVSYVQASKSEYWLSTFQIESVSVGDYKSKEGEHFTAILDSGSPIIHAENHAHQAFYNKLNAQFDEKLKLFTVACNTANKLPTWSFKIGGVEYQVKPKEYLLELDTTGKTCALAIQHYSSEGFGFTLGQPFMRSYCTVFDVSSNRFGFAQPKLN